MPRLGAAEAAAVAAGKSVTAGSGDGAAKGVSYSLRDAFGALQQADMRADVQLRSCIRVQAADVVLVGTEVVVLYSEGNGNWYTVPYSAVDAIVTREVVVL